MAHVGFAAVERSAAASGAENPAAVAAAIGRRKYGAAKMAHAAATGHALKESQAKRHGQRRALAKD